MKSHTTFKLFVISLLAIMFSESILAQQGTVNVQQDSKIPQLLSLKKNLEKENKLSDGYTIQLYYGELSKANSIIKKYRGIYGTWPASIEYETPNYKVWVGNFGSRLDADRALMEIQKNFQSAFILKPERRK
ncbi:SPOR domain-containing protein [Cochleicola gelatinilyticus]|uniref:Translation initiation factor IF-2 n=1 Tax=Cochleicola gelatinilyticus TaxID=1763537 RepID=A0A167JCY1_9FLAO|nr:SPOR domain-containing protein [Cochleicola gelatinilyticus]OAB80551.1 translation initiation factor IF-2 [Cochleicola gelatinilyticus]